MAEPDLEHGIYRVVHFALVGKKKFVAESDLIFDNEGPLVVMEWAGPTTNQHPSVTVRLDMARLTESPPGSGRFVYDGEVADPRSQH